MKKKILFFGISGLLGSNLYKIFLKKKKYSIRGVCREKSFSSLSSEMKSRVLKVKHFKNISELDVLFKKFKPDFVINCVGTIKQSKNMNKFNEVVFINSLFPHVLSLLCNLNKARLIHFSTDCVFLGSKGNYKENHKLDADDFYGLSKIQGEISNKNSITLRTSIIGKELKNKKSLLEWFLSQKGKIYGFSKVIFSAFSLLLQYTDNCVFNSSTSFFNDSQQHPRVTGISIILLYVSLYNA